MTNKETIELLNEVINAGTECYFAFNKLSVKTRINFSFYGTDLYDALEMLKGWKKRIEDKEQ